MSGVQSSEAQHQQFIDQYEASSELIVDPDLNVESALEETGTDFVEGLETILDTFVTPCFASNNDETIDSPLVPEIPAWQQQESADDDYDNDDYDENVPTLVNRDIVPISSSGQSLFLGLEPAELLVFCEPIRMLHGIDVTQADPFEMIRSFARSLSHTISQKIRFDAYKAFLQSQSTYCTPCSHFHCST